MTKYYVLDQVGTMYDVCDTLKDAKESIPDPTLARGEYAYRDIYRGNVTPQADYELSREEMAQVSYVGSYRGTRRTVRRYPQ